MKFSLLLFLTSVICFTPFYSSDFCSQTITNDCNTTFSYIDNINDEVYPILKRLITSSYFKYFKINFDKQCKFWDTEFFCASQNCAVEILPKGSVNWDEDIILNESKPDYKIKNHEDLLESCKELDYCELDDDENCDLINLSDNPERFTGYAGKQAQNIWSAIYNENCFKLDDGSDNDDCSAKQLFLRVVSGMHASISTHLSNEYLLDMEDIESVSPNLGIFMERVGKFNDRISNLYFNYGLISQSIIKLFKNYPIIEFLKQLEDLIENKDNYDLNFNKLIELLDKEQIFKSQLIIEPELKDAFRSKFRNISSIMDCVGCDRCRMWGKLQTIGYGTALKILFEETNSNDLVFRRIEIVSLLNTFDRLSKSIESVKNFKRMYLQHLKDVERGLVQPGDFDKLNENNGLRFPFSNDSKFLRSKINKMTETKEEPKEETKEEIVEEEEEKEEVEIKDQRSRFRKDFDQSMDEVFKALKFVLNAYRVFPEYIFKQTLIRLNYYWNTFIGIDNNEYYEEFQLQQEQQYMDLFNE